MLRQEEKKLNYDELLDLVQDVFLAIQDNNQNMKDCAQLLRSIQNIIEPKKKTVWEKIKDLFH